MSLQPADPVEHHRMPLIEHLRELRYRILVSGAALTVGMVGGLTFATDVYDFLRAPIQVVFSETPTSKMDSFYLWLTDPIQRVMPPFHVQGSLNLSNSPLEAMYAWFQIGLISGLVLASPMIAYQIWQFIAPALYPEEKRLVAPLTVSSAVLFSVGALFCYAVIFPVSLPFFLTTLPGTTNQISVQGYLSDVVWMMIGFGLSFQLPVIVWFLAKVGLIDHLDMIRSFRYAIVGIFFAAAVITPTTDLFSQCLLAFPLLGLYILGIGVAYFATSKTRSVEGI